MTIVNRTFVQFLIDGALAGGITDIDTTTIPITPNGQKWQVTRVIFADPNVGDNLSTGFRVEFGTGGNWEFIVGGYLSGNMQQLTINKVFTGDGTKRFRVIRQNISAITKSPAVFIEAFKREGD